MDDGKTFKIVGADMSDGYHTFDELYEHRCVLFLAICLMRRDEVIWKPHYPGWPLLVLKSPVGQISYHIPERHQPALEHNFRRDDAFEWDGHTPADVLSRLSALCGGLSLIRPIAQPGAAS